MSALDLDEAERFANSVDDNVRTELLPVVEYAKECQARIAELEAALIIAENVCKRMDAKMKDGGPHLLGCDCSGFNTNDFTKPYPTCANLMEAYRQWRTSRFPNE